MNGLDSNRIAVFIDAENFLLSAQEAGLPVRIGRLVSRLREEGVISFARAYGDWTQPHLRAHMQKFHDSVIELNQLSSSFGKNTADMQAVVDALEMALLPSAPEVFVIVAGDRDFVPLVQKLKRYGKTVIGLGMRGSTSRWLEAICDSFLYYDSIVKPVTAEDGAQAAPVIGSELESSSSSAAAAVPADDRETVFNLLVRAVASQERNGSPTVGAAIRPLMQRLDPTFDLARFAYSTFKQLVLDAQEKGYVRVHLRGGEDFTLESTAEVQESTSDTEEDIEYDFQTPEEAVTVYRNVLQEKGVPLIAWEQRQKLIRAVWDAFADSPGGLTIAEMSRIMLDVSSNEDWKIPDRAVQKLTYSLNLGRAFKRFVNDIWEEKVTPACSVEEAAERVSETYVIGLTRDRPDLRLDEEGLALLLFDSSDEKCVEAAGQILEKVLPGTARRGGRH